MTDSLLLLVAFGGEKSKEIPMMAPDNESERFRFEYFRINLQKAADVAACDRCGRPHKGGGHLNIPYFMSFLH